jgi:hypothetical protein
MNRFLFVIFCWWSFNSVAGEQRAFQPAAIWPDNNGVHINAHGGGMLYHAGRYYWYGENKEGRTWLPESTKAWEGWRVDVTGVRCYSSKDLLNWRDEGLVLKAEPGNPAHRKSSRRPATLHHPR